MENKKKEINVVVFSPLFGCKPQAIEDKLETYYKLIGCELIDIVKRKIGGKYFEIVCDDEAKLKAEVPPVSGHVKDSYDEFVGVLVICGEADKEGALTSLSFEDYQLIKENVGTYLYVKDEKTAFPAAFVSMEY